MKKNLLNESEIRKFMKFANLGTLTENFVEKIDETVWGGNEGEESETHPGEEDYTTKKGEELKHDEPGGWGEKEGDEADVNEEVLAEDGDDVHDLVKRLVQRIADWADEEAGVEVSVEDAEVGGEEGIEDISAEEEGEDLDGDLGGEDLGGEESIPGDEDIESGAVVSDEEEMVAEDALVAEVTRRVATRLLKENKKL